MILYPAIDLKNGACVRLKQGALSSATVYNTSPAQQALFFEEQGFSYLHVVDLDGAFSGGSQNKDAVCAILEKTSLPIQLGGGIRSLEAITFWLEQQVDRVILGTIAVSSPELVKEACRLFPGQIVVGIDARGGLVAVEGWSQTSTLKASELALRFEDAGVSALVYTDIERDGMLGGPNWQETLELAEKTTIPVIVSGGMHSLTDLQHLKTPPYTKISGAILGRALYEGTINGREAIKLFLEE